MTFANKKDSIQPAQNAQADKSIPWSHYNFVDPEEQKEFKVNALLCLRRCDG